MLIFLNDLYVAKKNFHTGLDLELIVALDFRHLISMLMIECNVQYKPIDSGQVVR